MDMGRSSTTVVRVVRGRQGSWEVREEGLQKPLSSFASLEEAKDYAEGIACRAGTVVEVYSEDGRLQSRVSAPG